ncbi:MAG: hypothetical protein MUC50_00455 [Myxococcota bacterium]|jgi:hypothetical protein|nr:hypothetical protein [Myxococcota bacterium]
MPCGLNDSFFADLKDGLLSAFLERVRLDRTLCLELRNNYVNIYYRGGSLLRIDPAGQGYTATFDLKYLRGCEDLVSVTLPSSNLRNSSDVAAWLSAFPSLKLAMDLHFGRHPKEEREAQQLMVRENNFGSMSRATDYYICDLEYANRHGRFDLVAVHWPSESMSRRQCIGRRLVLVEVKYGEGAIDGTAGVHSHIVDINTFLNDASNLVALKQEMVRVFNQKRALGLVDCGLDLEGFSDEPPMLLLVLVNHDPASVKLRRALETLPPSPHAPVYLATPCLLGYGLFDQAVLPLEEARLCFADCL